MIREASIDDARGIAHAHVLAWQAAYRGLVTDDYLDALSVDHHETLWTRVLSEAAARDQRIWVSGYPDVNGFICVGPSRDDDANPAHVAELQAIYLVPSVWDGVEMHELRLRLTL